MSAAEDFDDYDLVHRILDAQEGESLHDAAARVLAENWRGTKRKLANVIIAAARVSPQGSWDAVRKAAEIARSGGKS